MFTTLYPKYISLFRFAFKGSFSSTSLNTKSSFAYKLVAISFIRNNIINKDSNIGPIVNLI